MHRYCSFHRVGFFGSLPDAELPALGDAAIDHSSSWDELARTREMQKETSDNTLPIDTVIKSHPR
ncbi:MAG: hypothetical protein ACK523_06850, partial [Pirellulaceae bacterium]